MRALFVVAFAALSGCAMEANVDVARAPKMMECVDTRDGERFSFRPRDVTNVRMGILGADSCYDVVDTAGAQRTLCSSHEAFIKCKGVAR